MAASVEIEIVGRRDALALYERLTPYHSYLVQSGGERWLVHAATPGWHEEQLPQALETIGSYLAERGIGAASIRVNE